MKQQTIQLTNDLKTKFTSKIKKTKKHWYLTPTNKKTEYQKFFFKHKTYLAHRISFLIFKGKIPNGRQIDHICKDKHCINPEHLKAVTPKENIKTRTKSTLNQYCRFGHKLTLNNIRKADFEKRGIRRCKKCRNNYQKKRYNERTLGSNDPKV